MLYARRYIRWLAVVMLCQGAACQAVLGLDDTRPRGDGGADGADGADGAGCAGETCDWWNESYTRRRRVHIEDGMVAADVSNLPVLVTLDATRIDYGAAGVDGASLRFVADDHATELAHEIEEWQAGGTSHVWVLVPLVPQSGVDIWMYYGNAEAAPGDRPAELWQAAGYESVHHLDQNYLDSSGHGHDGTESGQPDKLQGKIAGGYDFNGIDEYVELAGEGSFDFQTSMSLEVWIRVDEFDIAWQPVVAKGDNSWRLHRHDVNNTLAFGGNDSLNQADFNLSMTSQIPINQWHHVAASWDGQQMILYLDGEPDATAGYAVTLHDSDAPVRIGHNSEISSRYFDGDVDELRIAPVARTAEWIAAAYAAMAEPGFISYAAEDEIY